MTSYHYLCNPAFFPRGWKWQLALPGLECLPEPADLLRADCLVVYLPGILSTGHASALRRLRRVAPRGQVRVRETLESPDHYPQFDEPAFMSMFDLEASYRQSADIWTPYLPVSLADGRLQRQPGWRSRLCCAFISSAFDRSGRRAFAAELMQHVRVDSFGRCMRNRKLRFDRGVST
jgi:hypothetical protein